MECRIIDISYRGILDACDVGYTIASNMLILSDDTDTNIIRVLNMSSRLHSVTRMKRYNKCASVVIVPNNEYDVLNRIAAIKKLDVSIFLHRYLNVMFSNLQRGDVIEVTNDHLNILHRFIWDSGKLSRITYSRDTIIIPPEIKIITEIPISYWDRYFDFEDVQVYTDLTQLDVISIDYNCQSSTDEDGNASLITTHGHISKGYENYYDEDVSVITVRASSSSRGYSQIMVTNTEDTKNSSDVYRKVLNCKNFSLLRDVKLFTHLLYSPLDNISSDLAIARDERRKLVKETLNGTIPKELANLVSSYVY